MNFFEHQDKAIKTSKWLIVLFLLAIVGIIAATYFPAQWFMSQYVWHSAILQGVFVKDNPIIWNYPLFLKISLGTLTIIAIGTIKRIYDLAAGGQIVAQMMGGRLIEPATIDPIEKKILNVVEEMSIASGIPVPNVYLLDREYAINAFAAGHTIGDAVVGVTRGTVEKLNRDELQGVIAHEFSHIFHGDMKLNIRLMGLLYGILSISMIGQAIVRGSGRTSNRKGGDGIIFAGLAMVAIGWIGYFFARLIQAAVARQREMLADASAVQYTRNPEGIETALKKIGGYAHAPATGSHILNHNAQQISHMTFGSIHFGELFGLFASHPPIEKRIQAIDPHFDPIKEKMIPAEDAIATQLTSEGDSSRRKVLLGGKMVAVSKKIHYQTNDLIQQAGTIPLMAITQQEQWISNLQPEIEAACRHPQRAKAVVYVLVADFNQACLPKFEHILQVDDPYIVPIFKTLCGSVNQSGADSRLKILALCLPSLKQLPVAEYQQFAKTLIDLVNEDGKVSLFEFLLMKIVRKHLRNYFFPTKASNPSIHDIHDIKNEIKSILLALAQQDGLENESLGRGSFEKGFQHLFPDETFAYSQQSENLKILDIAFKTVAKTDFSIRQKILEACLAVVQFDQKVSYKEMELLRALGDTIDCPIPALN